LFCLALLVSDPKATSRCLQNLGRAALSAQKSQFVNSNGTHLAAMPAYLNPQPSVGSRACTAIPSGKNVLGAGKQGKHPQKSQNETIRGGFFLLLSSINMLAFSIAGNWPPSTSRARQTSTCMLQEDSITGEGSSHSSPSHPYST